MLLSTSQEISVGITQGRLSLPVDHNLQAFPAETWSEELKLAKDSGFSFMEWILDVKSRDSNPYTSKSGVSKIHARSVQVQLPVRSVCDDTIMEESIFSRSKLESKKYLEWLIEQAHLAHMNRIILPFFKASAITGKGEVDQLIDMLDAVSEKADRHGIQCFLETSLDPEIFYSLMDKITNPHVRIIYDTGNSAFFGFNPKEEISILYKWIGCVHIKDHLLKGPSVPLGSGDVDFTECFQLLAQYGFNGDFVLQAARKTSGKEIDLAKHYLKFVKDRWEEAFA